MARKQSSSEASADESPWNIIKNPSSGRTRISQACDRCRARKIRCSGKSETNPRCTNCEKDGFQCVVSDKLTRNSFPKGYTKNLEKKLLDVELDRNRLQLELKQLRAKLGVDTTAVAAVPTSSVTSLESDADTSKMDIGTTSGPDSGPSDSESLHETGHHHHNNTVDCNSCSGCHDETCCSPVSPIYTNADGLLKLDQFLVLPFNSTLSKWEIHSFNGYEPSARRNSTTIDTPCGTPDDPEMMTLMNFHINLNRYLNLVLYRLIFPAFSAGTDANAEGKIASSSGGHNLDHLIWIFFNVYNKLIPILDFELFYNDYLTFINKYTANNSTYIENGEPKKRYYEFSCKEQDILIKLILILKFTLSAPKGSAVSSIPDRDSYNQTDESIKLINLKNLKMMLRNTNFATNLTTDKFEIALLFYYYLLKFENYNAVSETQRNSSQMMFKIELLRDVTQLCTFLKGALHFDCDSSHLKMPNRTSGNEQVVKIQRLKLYWDFEILSQLAEIYFTIDFRTTDNAAMRPQSLESIRLVNPDVEITFQLLDLLTVVPKNFLQLCADNDRSALKEVDKDLKRWIAEVDKIENEDNEPIINKLKTYYYYFSVLVHLNGSKKELCRSCTSYIDIAYNLIFENNSEVSIENAENLSLHSFNFHLICMISLITLGNSAKQSDELSSRLLRIAQLYQLLVSIRSVEPLIADLTKYVCGSVLSGLFNDLAPVKKESLGLFSYGMSRSSSLFKKPSVDDSKMTFDIGSLKGPKESRKRKSHSPHDSDVSSVSSKRLSISSSGTGTTTTIPSLFSGAALPPSEIMGKSPSFLRGRSHSVDVKSSANMTTLRQKLSEDPSLSRSQSETGDPAPASLLNEINLSLGLSDFCEPRDKSRPTLPTIPSATNLEVTFAEGSSFFDETTPKTGMSAEDLTKLMQQPSSIGNPFRDDDDLMRLKERVLNMKASKTSTTMG